jgi:4-hydroxyphenylpyruvate dioxygenase
MAPSAVTPPILTPTSLTFPTSNNTSAAVDGTPNFHGYDHITWYVGNAKQAASFYTTRLGFSTIAYKGLETGSRYIASHVVGNDDIRFVLTSPIKSYTSLDGDEPISSEDRSLLKEIYQHLEKHGDAVKDVAFEVDNVEAVYRQAVEQGAVSVQPPRKRADENGFVTTAIIRTYGDTTHTLISRDSNSTHFNASSLPSNLKQSTTVSAIKTGAPWKQRVHIMRNVSPSTVSGPSMTRKYLLSFRH